MPGLTIFLIECFVAHTTFAAKLLIDSPDWRFAHAFLLKTPSPLLRGLGWFKFSGGQHRGEVGSAGICA